MICIYISMGEFREYRGCCSDKEPTQHCGQPYTNICCELCAMCEDKMIEAYVRVHLNVSPCSRACSVFVSQSVRLCGNLQMLPMWIMFNDFLDLTACACFVKLQLDWSAFGVRREGRGAVVRNRNAVAVSKNRTRETNAKSHAASQQVPLSSNAPGTCKLPWRTSRPRPWQPCAPTAQWTAFVQARTAHTAQRQQNRMQQTHIWTYPCRFPHMPAYSPTGRASTITLAVRPILHCSAVTLNAHHSFGRWRKYLYSLLHGTMFVSVKSAKKYCFFYLENRVHDTRHVYF